MKITTLDTPDGLLAVVTVHEDELQSDAHEAATEALISALEVPARAVYVDAAPVSETAWKITYRAELTRHIYEDGPALRGASQPSLFSA